LRARGAPESQTLIVPSSRDPDTILVPSRENATDVMMPPWAFVFSLNISSLPARQARRRQFWLRRVDFEGKSAPKSQTLIVPSADPDTILVPFGDNATDMMGKPCAFVFSLRSPSTSVRQASKRQFGPRKGDFEGSAHRNPKPRL
jgi:hypothetical protein